jgi:hypothetical protein
MSTLSQKCETINAVSAFCDCIAGEEQVYPAVREFCNHARTDKNVTDKDLINLKMTLSDREEESREACCDDC